MRFVLFASAAFCALAGVASGERPLICYWESWSVYRALPYKGNASDLPVDKCNHIVYAFLGLDWSTYKVRYLDPWQDIDSGTIGKFVALKKVRPDLRVSFAIGGWNEGSEHYSKMASTASGRATFAASVASVITTHGFDGVDLDWEYPAMRGGDPTVDKANFVLLLQAVRKAIGNKKLLTVAVSANANSLDSSYDVPEIAKVVNYIHVMSYDLRGPWESTVDNHVLLHGRKSDSGGKALLNVADALSAWRSRGAPPNKLIMGFAFYGKSFTLTDPRKATIGSPAKGPGQRGPISQAEGTLFYFEICKLLLTNDDFSYVWDSEGKVPYAFGGDQWVGFDDEKSIKLKVDLIKSAGYAGAMVWAVGQDDSAGQCVGKINYPLLTALNNYLNENEELSSSSNPISDTASDRTITVDNSITRQNSTEPDLETTVKSISTTVVSTTKTTLPPLRCESPTYPHTMFCQKFFICDNVGPIRMIELSCPAGLVFNEDLGVCDWNFNTHPAPVGCPDFV
ncbi:acidic mammalian chitinase-like [Tropilaelaps mercedesae]|uniref:Acidic mammalian chitinase-like n=1 Tax=Tropilaelaps mercedesae TaxID=418985 RepID=A0A1V9XTL5_9ACAR|nr:acidic mammalian chitinase-like [Tropilaelaps mercedesae]